MENERAPRIEPCSWCKVAGRRRKEVDNGPRVIEGGRKHRE